jgi:hypothetical protein
MTDDNEVDFDTAVRDPAAFYATPEAVAADADLTDGQKRRFLTAWAQDIEDRQVGIDEGMTAATTSGSDNDAERLQRIHHCLANLPDDAEDEAPALARFWRRLLAD